MPKDYQVGDSVRYRISYRYDQNTHIETIEFVAAEIIAIGPKRVTIKLVNFPQWRARNVSPDRIWF